MKVLRLLWRLAFAATLIAAFANGNDPYNSRNPVEHPRDLEIPLHQLLPAEDRWPDRSRNVRPRLPDLNVPAAGSGGASPLLSPFAASSVGSSSPVPNLPSSSRRKSVMPYQWPTKLYPSGAEPSSDRGRARQNPIAIPTTTAVEDRVPAEIDEMGRRWGPYPVQQTHFLPIAYPLKLGALSHLYSTHDGTVPADFKPTTRQIKDARRTGINVRLLTYRPDPELLRNIQGILVGELEKHKIPMLSVENVPEGLQEGTFLWPPLERAPSGLQLPAEARQRLTYIPGDRVRRKAGNLFYMVVPTSGSDRHILLTTANTANWTPLPNSDSKLWMFFEGRKAVKDEQHSLSFLGAMFLPGDAKKQLLRAGALTEYVPDVAK